MGLMIPYKGKRPKVDPSVFIAPTACVAGNVTIGRDSSIWFGAVVRGDFQPIQIGRCTNVQANATIHVMGACPLSIGSHVIIGHNAIIHSRTIGSNTLIGMGAILLGYTEIGDNCSIGAGSLTTQHKKIPDNSIVYGNPAKIIRALRDDEIEALRESALAHAELARAYKAEVL